MEIGDVRQHNPQCAKAIKLHTTFEICEIFDDELNDFSRFFNLFHACVLHTAIARR